MKHTFELKFKKHNPDANFQSVLTIEVELRKYYKAVFPLNPSLFEEARNGKCGYIYLYTKAILISDTKEEEVTMDCFFNIISMFKQYLENKEDAELFDKLYLVNLFRGRTLNNVPLDVIEFLETLKFTEKGK